MNMNMVKEKLSQFKKTSSPTQNNQDWKDLFWKPSIGKQTVRVVPSKFNEDWPFTEMLFYYIIEGKTIASPQNWGEKDPVNEFVEQLRKNYNENKDLIKKLYPKTRVFAPVIVRGEESKGVRLWQFGKEIYESFVQMADDEEVGDYTSIMEGRDIKLITVGPEVTGTKYNKTSVSPSLKISPLSENSEEVEKWMDEQKNPLRIYKPLPFDTIKEMLQNWLAPEDEEEEDAEVNSNYQSEDTSNYSLSSQGKAKSKAAQFDDLFEEEEEEDDDLPF